MRSTYVIRRKREAAKVHCHIGENSGNCGWRASQTQYPYSVAFITRIFITARLDFSTRIRSIITSSSVVRAHDGSRCTHWATLIVLLIRNKSTEFPYIYPLAGSFSCSVLSQPAVKGLNIFTARARYSPRAGDILFDQ